MPYCTGSIGLLGTKPSWDMMQDADTLLMVGSSFPYSEFLPTTGQAKAVQVDLSARMLSIRYPMDLALVGDAKETLAELVPLLKPQSGPLLARQDHRQRKAVVGGDGRRRSTIGPQRPDTAPGVVFCRCPVTCPIRPSCRRTRGPRRTGTPAISASGGA